MALHQHQLLSLMLPARFIHEVAEVPPQPVVQVPLPSPQQLNVWLCQIALAWYAIDKPSVDLLRELGAALSGAIVALENLSRAQRMDRALVPPAPEPPSGSRRRAPTVARRPAGRHRSRSPRRGGGTGLLRAAFAARGRTRQGHPRVVGADARGLKTGPD